MKIYKYLLFILFILGCKEPVKEQKMVEVNFLLPPATILSPVITPINYTLLNTNSAGAKKAPNCIPKDIGIVYTVNTEQYPELHNIPWNNLQPDDVICVPYRKEPYRTKIYFITRGLPEHPIRLVGLRSPTGERPIIDGDQALTSSIIKPNIADEHLSQYGLITLMTHFVSPASSAWGWHPGWIEISGLKIQHARPQYKYKNSLDNFVSYADFSAAIYINPADNLIIEDCEINDNQIGVFSKSFELTPGQQDRTTVSVTLRGNYIHDNGNATQLGIHNVYLEGRGCNLIGNFFQWKKGNVGANVKTRCAHERIYANTFLGGFQAMLQQMDPQSGWDSIGVADDFEPTVVAGNIFIDNLGGMGGPYINFGGDSYTDSSHYRKKLISINNTFINMGVLGARTPVLSLNYLTKDDPFVSSWFINNVVINKSSIVKLAMVSGKGTLFLSNNWLGSTPIFDPYEKRKGIVKIINPILGTNQIIDDTTLLPIIKSPIIDCGLSYSFLPSSCAATVVNDFQLFEVTGTPENPWYKVRNINDKIDLGAYEFEQ